MWRSFEGYIPCLHRNEDVGSILMLQVASGTAMTAEAVHSARMETNESNRIGEVMLKVEQELSTARVCQLLSRATERDKPKAHGR